jgi:acetylglutamate kinase
MEKFIEKADVLIEALPYIKRFYGNCVVIKFGGSIMSDEASVRRILEDIVFMKFVGMHPIVIHGGGPEISETMQKQGLRPHFVDGLRVTDRETMDIVEDVLVHKINKKIVDILNEMDGNAEGLSGKDEELIMVKKRANIESKTSGKLIDLGFVGDVSAVNPIKLKQMKDEGKIPVIAPVGMGQDGLSYNINGDEAAGEIASALGADKLALLSDVKGIMMDINEEDSFVSTIKSDEVEELLEKGVIHGGMIPKINSCVKALKSGARKAHIIDGRISHSLLLEMFTVKGIGTEILHG